MFSKDRVIKIFYKIDDFCKEYNLRIRTIKRLSSPELNELFCVTNKRGSSNPHIEELLLGICKDLGKKGIITLKQWEKYISEHPSGYALTQFPTAIQRYHMITNPSMHMEHEAKDKLF